MITISEAKFITSAPTLQHAPDLQGIPEVVLIGRSNVGKSTFINAMCNNKSLAKTSNTPGKTRLMNFYKIAVNKGKNAPQKIPLAFVDLPGYGYAKVSKTEQDEWQKNLTQYLERREEIALCVQLVDARHGPQDSDIAMFDWMGQRELPQLVLMTKIDKLKKNEIANQRTLTADRLQVDEAHVIPFNGVKPDNRDALWSLILEGISG